MDATFAHSATWLRERSHTARRVLTPGAVLCAGLWLYVVVVPNLNLLPGVAAYNEKRLLQLALLLSGAVLLLASGRMRATWLRTFGALPAAVRCALGAVLVLGMASAARAPLPQYAFLDVAHYGLLFGLVVCVAGVCRRAPEAFSKGLVAAVALSAFLYSIVFLVGYAVHLLNASMPLWPEAYLGFANIRFLNQHQTWTLPLLVVAPALLAGRSRVLRGAFYGLASVWWMLVLASGGRGTPLAMGTAFAFAALAYRRAAWPWLKRQLMTLLAGGVLFLSCFKAVAVTQSSMMERAVMRGGLRIPAWNEALDMMAAFPLLGVGPMHFGYHPYGSTFAHPHNVALQWAAEWGLPAALLVFGLVAWGLWTWVQRVRQDICTEKGLSGAPSASATMRIALTGALVAGGTHALLSGLAIMPLSQLLMVMVLGCAWGLSRNKESHFEATPRRASRALQMVCAAAFGATLWGAAGDALHLDARQAAFIEEAKPSVLWPRYWQQGYIGYSSAHAMSASTASRWRSASLTHMRSTRAMSSVSGLPVSRAMRASSSNTFCIAHPRLMKKDDAPSTPAPEPVFGPVANARRSP